MDADNNALWQQYRYLNQKTWRVNVQAWHMYENNEK
jgi:hypothetical protein